MVAKNGMDVASKTGGLAISKFPVTIVVAERPKSDGFLIAMARDN